MFIHAFYQGRQVFQMRTPFKIALAMALLLFVAAFFLMDTIPPRSLTATRMHVTKRRILQYAQRHNGLPPMLAELPAMPGYDTKTTDGWGRPLDYSFDSSGAVTLRSLGADKRPGGDGDNRDMTGVFHSRDAQGRWQDELVKWEQDPSKR